MSFSGTPLGQGRRLDHQSFLNSAIQPQNTTSPPRKAASASSIPLSYAYGAPTFGNRSPGKPPSPTLSPRAARNASPTRSNTSSYHQQGAEDDAEEEERALARYARLKQRNQALANRPGASLGPGIITTPPQPNGTSLKDTSVNIASAFHQAASTFTAMSNGSNANTAWSTGSRANYPRSTSVEYEQQAQNSSHRRLAVPPSRTGSRTSNTNKPQSKSRSAQNASDAENDRSGDSVDANGRGKSPFEHLAEFTKRAALAPTAYLMRQRSQEPEAPPSRQTTDATLVGQGNNSSSYDYQEEEEEYQKSVKPSSKRAGAPASTSASAAAAHKRGRMSVDNKAYRPTMSDLESESEGEEDEDGSKRRRRKAKKKDGTGGPLTTLPVTQYDKRRRRKGRGSKGGDEDEGSVSDEHASEQRSARSATPAQQQQTALRTSVPPLGRASVSREVQPEEPSTEYDNSGPTDQSMDLEQGLSPIQEFELEKEECPSKEYRASLASSEPRPPRSGPSFSIGAFLGKGVNLFYRAGHAAVGFVFKMLALVMLLVGRVVGSIFDLFVRAPMRLASQPGGVSHFGKYLVVGLGMYVAWYTLRHPTILGLSGGFHQGQYGQGKGQYQPLDMPPGSLEDLTAWISRVENVLMDVQSSMQTTHSRFENELKKQSGMVSKVNSLENWVDKEALRAQRSEEDYRLALAQTIERLNGEIRGVQQQVDGVARSPPISGSASDEDARAKVKALEEQMGMMDGRLQHAIELAKNAVAKTSAPGAVAASSGAAWWNKLTSGTATGTGVGLTIKAADGTDVTALITHLVGDTIARYTRKDELARVDYALHSGGASVIPGLTSPTMEINRRAKRSYLYSLFSNDAQILMGRPPVTALHHELHTGHCWPFVGSVGQLGVALAAPVYIEEVTIDHVAREVAHDMRTAPREMELWGMVEGEENMERYRAYIERREQARRDALAEGSGGEAQAPEVDTYPATLRSSGVRYMRVAAFTYDVHAPNNIQTFPASKEVRELGIDFGLVVLLVKSNWGADFTCLYRLRVHGTRLHDIPEVPSLQDLSQS
ncbi:hypothetical protein BD410DRAFT_751579 [Rickenella mellea]|uniref:SUN domain-containing protein n=1 Tax=Rickenella mellea TaxID=50990 RepID=A0A4Y7PWX1_9AGAM|nr:hypothetical protein BD410DRAFT_751579 [Rickenella mellea]